MKQLGYEGDLLERRDDQGLAMFWLTAEFRLVASEQAALHDLAETYLQVGAMYRVRQNSNPRRFRSALNGIFARATLID